MTTDSPKHENGISFPLIFQSFSDSNLRRCRAVPLAVTPSPWDTHSSCTCEHEGRRRHYWQGGQKCRRSSWPDRRKGGRQQSHSGCSWTCSHHQRLRWSCLKGMPISAVSSVASFLTFPRLTTSSLHNSLLQRHRPQSHHHHLPHILLSASLSHTTWWALLLAEMDSR